MKDNEIENRPQANQRVRDKSQSQTPMDDSLSGMPPAVEDNRVITRQNRFVTYYVDKPNEQNMSPEQKRDEETVNDAPSAEQDLVNAEKPDHETEIKVEPKEDTDTQHKPSKIKNVKVNPEKYNPEDKALRSFADVLIKQLQQIEVGDWTRPWIFGSDSKWPHNLDGREYASNNAIILLMHTQQRGYTAPVYATYERFRKLNFVEGTKDQPVTDDQGKPLPKVIVKGGEKHMPVVKTIYTAVHKLTREKLDYSDYAKLSAEEKKEYNVFPKNFTYCVFNIDQTNLKEARPELYEQLTKSNGRKFSEIRRDEDMCFPAVDAMIMKNLWQCPIVIQYSPSAHYSPMQDKIYLPQKHQFKYPESYYGTLFHECAHSTGAHHRYDRGLGKMDQKQYAREELVAELTAALVASRYGLTKHVKSDSLPYLKSWLNNLKEEPEFIKELLSDVRKASSQIIRRVDLLQNRIEELRSMGVPEPEYYPNFIDVNPITNQPVDDPLRYMSKEEDQIEERPSFGRGRR